MEFWICFCFFAISGVLGFLLGRVLPKKWFRPEGFLFRCRQFERGGKLYEKLHIRRWQNHLPDMSRILPGVMPPKNLSGDYAARLPLMLQETCVAEFIHLFLCVTGLHSLRLWQGIGGVVVYLIFVIVFNLPYIIIQRYNRPRLMTLYKKLEAGRSQPIEEAI